MRTIINAAGPITPLGAGIVDPEVISAVSGILGRSVEVAELQSIASRVISEAFGCEAGAVIGCTAAGLSIACAAAMTGSDLARVEQLPDTTGMKSRIILQKAHDCWFGAYVGQMIRLSGAQITYIGDAKRANGRDLEAAITSETAAAMFVASHHVPSHGLIGLDEFIAICRSARVPVIVDAAGTVDLRLYIKAGASLVLGSAHKNFGGLTAGIAAGGTELIEACLLQDRGIGRAMKVGKEGFVAVIAALRQWSEKLQAEREVRWRKRAELMCDRLASVPGLRAELETDPPEDRIYRTRIAIDKNRLGLTAKELAERLWQGEPAIRVWEAGIKAGHFALDPRCLTDSEAANVCERVMAALASAGTLPQDAR